MSTKLTSGGTIPDLSVSLLGGGEATLGHTRTPGAWQLIFIYRGFH